MSYPLLDRVRDKLEWRPVWGLRREITLLRATIDALDLGLRFNCSTNYEGGVASWAAGFDGGVQLANHIFDNPSKFTGKCIFDVGAGSGLTAIAAAMIGVEDVIALDVNQTACEAIKANAEKIGVKLRVIHGDILDLNLADHGLSLDDIDIITAGDIFPHPGYNKQICAQLKTWNAAGKTIYAVASEDDLYELMFDRPHGPNDKYSPGFLIMEPNDRRAKPKRKLGPSAKRGEALRRQRLDFE